MIDLECPQCGRFGAVPNEKAKGRLVCRKCHAVFHLDVEGHVRVGEPPGTHEHAQMGKAAKPAALRLSLEDLPSVDLTMTDSSKAFLGVFGAVAILAGTYYTFFSGGETLSDATNRVAAAIAAGDLTAVKRAALDGSEDDIVVAYAEVHKELEGLKKAAAAGGINVSSMVIEEDRRQKNGSSAAFYALGSGAPTEAPPSPKGGSAHAQKRSLEVNLPWKLDGSGRWKLDGHRLLQLVGPLGSVQ